MEKGLDEILFPLVNNSIQNFTGSCILISLRGSSRSSSRVTTPPLIGWLAKALTQFPVMDEPGVKNDGFGLNQRHFVSAAARDASTS
ncbi:hypothetical protein RRG08_051973 [Elysia crispata]|uniref:Uncharacterized protein n=1 Tax=Elysia crispata TaxID=231223 RepID=A0AAE1DEU1_9GAST|nr:hypothetical protein RRG08_051973 [Elysia crispata]